MTEPTLQPLAIGELAYRPGPKAAASVKATEHAVHLPDSGAQLRLTPAFQRSRCRQELPRPQSGRATETGPAAPRHDFLHSTNVVVMPVSRDHQTDGLRRVDANLLKVSKWARFTRRVDAGINDHPRTFAQVNDDALAVARSDQRYFEFVGVRRAAETCVHKSNFSMVSRAHSRPARRSLSVTTGRSRTWIRDTRCVVPPGVRS